MTDDLKAALESCWQENEGTKSDERFCRWCRHDQPGEHTLDCPCTILSLALQQRDALAAYIKAVQRSATMQGAVRLAKKTARTDLKEKLAEAVLQLEGALAMLRELGIEEMVR
jgi:hypothetical protein